MRTYLVLLILETDARCILADVCGGGLQFQPLHQCTESGHKANTSGPTQRHQHSAIELGLRTSDDHRIAHATLSQFRLLQRLQGQQQRQQPQERESPE